jgi:glycosyltransferase involved in cell wall biosynthesis
MRATRQARTDEGIARHCVVDLTTALHDYYDGGEGICRVEIETARAVLAAGGRAIWVDRSARRISEIERDTFAELFSRQPQVSTQNKQRLGRLGAWLRPNHRRYLDRAVGEIENDLNRNILLRRLRARAFVPGNEDIFLLFGDYWDRPGRKTPSALKRVQGAKIVTLIYDLVPIRRPELTWNAGQMSKSFPAYLRSAAALSDRVLTISNFTRDEFLRYCREQGLTPPPTRAVPLASDLDQRVEARFTSRLAGANLADRRFALMVSTLEPRKNHLFAYELWRRLAERLGPRSIPLVFAGRRGWLTDNLLARMESDPQMWGRHILFVEGPSDEELAWLYAHAAFTLYPSELEGWGLPITESLAFGTYCLAADNSALKEASQGLAWHADTLDGRAWLAEVERCMTDPSYLETKRKEIVARFVQRRWSDFFADVISEVEEMGVTRAPAKARQRVE